MRNIVAVLVQSSYAGAMSDPLVGTSPNAIAQPPTPPADSAPDALKTAWNNTFNQAQLDVALWNSLRQTEYMATWASYQTDVLNGRTDPSNSAAPNYRAPPTPPMAYMVGYFDDGTTGPNTIIGITVDWPTPVLSTTPVCAMPTLQLPPPPITVGLLHPVADERNVPAGDTTPIGNLVTDPDGSMWVKMQRKNPFGVATFYQRIN